MTKHSSILPRYLLTALLLCGLIMPVSGHMHAPAGKAGAPIVSTVRKTPRPASDFDGFVPNALLF